MAVALFDAAGAVLHTGCLGGIHNQKKFEIPPNENNRHTHRDYVASKQIPLRHV